MPRAPSCFSLMAIASLFFSARVWPRTSSIREAAHSLLHNASKRFSANEPTCSTEETCSNRCIIVIQSPVTASWVGL
uniref:Putative secreted protein n=1 Tax=Panstrongylus lignarius TaxID=156445 RepID=A0A224XTB6_9HEMI